MPTIGSCQRKWYHGSPNTEALTAITDSHYWWHLLLLYIFRHYKVRWYIERIKIHGLDKKENINSNEPRPFESGSTTFTNFKTFLAQLRSWYYNNNNCKGIAPVWIICPIATISKFLITSAESFISRLNGFDAFLTGCTVYIILSYSLVSMY